MSFGFVRVVRIEAKKFEILDMRATGTPEGRNHQKSIIEVERVVKS
jgi:hypothetical protein